MDLKFATKNRFLLYKFSKKGHKKYKDSPTSLGNFGLSNALAMLGALASGRSFSSPACIQRSALWVWITKCCKKLCDKNLSKLSCSFLWLPQFNKILLPEEMESYVKKLKYISFWQIQSIWNQKKKRSVGTGRTFLWLEGSIADGPYEHFVKKLTFLFRNLV